MKYFVIAVVGAAIGLAILGAMWSHHSWVLTENESRQRRAEAWVDTVLPPEPAHWSAVSLHPYNVLRGTWKYDGRHYLRAYYDVSNNPAWSGDDSSLGVHAVLDESLRDVWEIWSIDLLEYNADTATYEVLTSVQTYLDVKHCFASREWFNDFYKPGKMYRLEIALHAFGYIDETLHRRAWGGILGDNNLVVILSN